MLPLTTQLLIAAAAQASQSADPELPPNGGPPGAAAEADILVTASRVDADAPGAISRITHAEIDRAQPVTLLEPLNDLAGVRAFSTGGPGGRSFLSIRGGEPNFTLVLLDGIRLNDPTNSRGGAFDFFALDPAIVESVEVTRGAASAVHGSDALAGVVNLRLRDRLDQTPVAVRAQAGIKGEHGLGGAGAESWEGGGLLVAGSWFDSGDLGPGSTIERRQALATLRQRLGGFSARILGLYGHGDRAAFPEDSGGPRLAGSRELERGTAELTVAGFTLRAASDARLRPNLLLSWARQRDRSATPAILPGTLSGTPPLTADSRFRRLEAVGDLGFTWGPLAGAVGAAWLDEEGRSDGTIDLGFPLPANFAFARTTRSLFAEAALLQDLPIGLGAAIRYDKVAGGRGRVTGRLRGSWRPDPQGPTLFAAIAEGYKLPSFYALAHPLIGNPMLRPERSRNLEAGLEGGAWRFAVFENRFRDLVDFDPTLFTTVNRDRVRTRGAEAEGRWQAMPALGFTGALTWVDLDSPTPLRGRPRWQGSLRAHWRAAAGLELNGAVRANSNFFDSSIPTGLVRAGKRLEADLGLRYRLSERLELCAVLRNLTGSRYEDAVGFPAAGPSLRATIGVGLF